MTVYEWKETEKHYIAIIRPHELFDQASVDVPDETISEGRLRAVHLFSKEYETYAFFYSKGKRKDFVMAHAAAIKDQSYERDMADLKKIRMRQQRKTA
jgi:hypothetical protein